MFIDLYPNNHFIHSNLFQMLICLSLSSFCLQRPIHDEDKPIIEATAHSYTYKAKSFYLLYRYGPSEDFNMLKLKSPSRLARETFLIALGIAKYEGSITNLNPSTVLFPDFHHFSPAEEKLPVIELANTVKIEEKLRNGRKTPELETTSSLDKGTPVNKKMMAIESELEQDMAHLRDRLEAKNKIVSELHHELNHLHDDYNASKSEFAECKRNLRLSERRIE